MKYMLLIHENPRTREFFGTPDGARVMHEMDAYMGGLQASGEMVGGEALADPTNTTTVRLADGVPAITDGPLAEAKEHFGGYVMVDVDSAERAAEIAARWLTFGGEAIEVRPLMTGSGEEM